MQSIAVFCGANKGNRPVFEAVTRELGHELARRNVQIVYGGGSVGLMGVLADAALENGGAVRGIITDQLHNLELGHPGVTDMEVVETMAIRRVQMLENTDGVITLPGGFGSMDELFEALTYAQLHLYHKPVGLLNVEGYYDPLVAMLNNMVSAGFLRESNRQFCIVANTVSELLEKMTTYQYNPADKWI
jgi:uncharacterized protein (TIGR00730 family)